MKIKMSILLCITGFLINRPLYAQEFTAFGNLLLGIPQGEFEENVDNVGYGLGGGFGYHMGVSPVMIGAEVEFIRYGDETRREPFSLTIPDVFVEVKTSNNIVLFHALLRLQSNRGSLRPYIDGLAGFSYFFTETKVQDEDTIGEDPIASSTNQDDTVFSYGVGGGLMIKLHESEKEVAGRVKRSAILLDFRVRYLFGGQATYLKEGSITRENGNVEIDAIDSETDILTFQLGVAYTF